MSPEGLRPQAPSASSSGGESLEGRLLQDRLRLFGGIAFVIAAAFYTVGQVLARLGRENPLTPAGHASVAAVTVLMGGTWLYCRAGRVPRGGCAPSTPCCCWHSGRWS